MVAIFYYRIDILLICGCAYNVNKKTSEPIIADNNRNMVLIINYNRRNRKIEYLLTFNKLLFDIISVENRVG